MSVHIPVVPPLPPHPAVAAGRIGAIGRPTGVVPSAPPRADGRAIRHPSLAVLVAAVIYPHLSRLLPARPSEG